MIKKNKEDDLVVLERAIRNCNQLLFLINLQKERIFNPTDINKFPISYFWDFQFFIITINRIKKIANYAKKNIENNNIIKDALNTFDKTLPWLTKLRNVGEHYDEYAIGKGYNKNVSKDMLDVCVVDWPKVFWLNETVNVDEATQQCVSIYESLHKTAEIYRVIK